MSPRFEGFSSSATTSPAVVGRYTVARVGAVRPHPVRSWELPPREGSAACSPESRQLGVGERGRQGCALSGQGHRIDVICGCEVIGGYEPVPGGPRRDVLERDVVLEAGEHGDVAHENPQVETYRPVPQV